MGVARTFQTLRLFLNMTVARTSWPPPTATPTRHRVESILRLPRARREEREVDARRRGGARLLRQRLQGYRWDQPAYSLSYANRRRLEIARAMATGRGSCCSTSPRPA